MYAIALVAYLTAAPVGRCQKHVEVIELNHVTNGDDSIKFTQIIIWRWTPLMPKSKFTVTDFFVIKDQEVSVAKIGHYHRVQWKKGRCIMVATCVTFKETFTSNDPEMDDRHSLPIHCRKPYFPDSH